MSGTHFKSMVYSMGIPVVGDSILTQGKSYFVKPRTGSDGNTGTDIDSAFKTLSHALSACVAGRNDVVYLFAEGNTSADTTDYQSATLTWSKDNTHLIGVGSPSLFSQRARIAQLSTATGVSPLVNVTANGCLFKNISIFHGVNDATSLVALQVTGSRNVFENVHIAGMGNATQVTAGAASLKLDGGSENVFTHCVIGLDTIARDNATNGEIWLDTAATRNVFEDCLIDAYVSNVGYTHVKVNDGTGIDRSLIFKNCLFMAKSTNKGITQTSVFSIPAISQGAIVLQNSFAFSDGGAVDWDSNNRGVIWNNNVAAAASAAGGIMTNQ